MSKVQGRGGVLKDAISILSSHVGVGKKFVKLVMNKIKTDLEGKKTEGAGSLLLKGSAPSLFL
jgi:hypothetical protein